MRNAQILAVVVSVFMSTWVRGDDGDLDKAIDKAVEILGKYSNEKEDTVPAEAFQKCKGLAILNVMKAGFIFSGSGGTGLVVVRTKNGKWSPPSAISAGGFGVGLQAGGSNIDYVILMNSDDAVEQFSKEGNYRGGVEAEGTAGTEGRNLSAGMAGMAGRALRRPMYYSTTAVSGCVRNTMKLLIRTYSHTHSQHSLYAQILLVRLG
ncbi:MAG: hypothetical protein EBU36_05695 [Verrucomicrobia bacterium]|nr:hypothetical protein [Verrucomicrobiota bacterium]